MKIIIIGGGENGLTLANILGEDYDITIVEKDEKLAKEIANETSALVIQGDGADISILKEAGIAEADALVAVTSDDRENLMISQIAKTQKVSKIIPLVNSPQNEELFTQLGLNLIISNVGTNMTAIKRALYQYGDERIIAQLGKGDVQIIQQTLSKESKLVGRQAKIKDAIIATIYRGGELTIPTEKTILEEGDVLIVAVKTKHLHSIAKIITGK